MEHAREVIEFIHDLNPVKAIKVRVSLVIWVHIEPKVLIMCIMKIYAWSSNYYTGSSTVEGIISS